jgi:aryl-alcohol dehydrogenase-like predicted oxidoreductase
VKGDATFDVVEAVVEIADGHSVPPAQVALAWLLAQPTVTAPIVGARTVEQVTGIAGAMRLRLTADEVKRLNKLTTPTHA